VRKDVGAYLDDPVAFAPAYMGVRPFDHQALVLRALEEVICVYKGRQTGLTTALLLKIGHFAMTRPRSTILFTSAGGRQAEDVGERFLEMARGQPIARSIVSDTKTTIRWSNGSVAHFLPSNPDTLRGYGPRWWARWQERKPGVLVIADEAPHIEQGEKVRRALQYALVAAPLGRRQLIMAGTPAGVNNWTYPIYRAGMDGEPGIRSFTFPTALNPHADAGLIGRLRGMATPEEQSQELDGVPLEGAASLFPGVLLDGAMVDGGPWPVPWREGFIYGIGADFREAWSQGKDRTAILVMGRGIVGGVEVWEVADLVVLARHTNAEATETILRKGAAYRVQRYLLESSAAGAVHEDLLGAFLPSKLISPTTGAQLEAFRFLYKLFEAGRMRIPRQAAYLESELRQCERRITETGLPQFGHPVGSSRVHDDTVYALLWACVALQDARPGSAWPEGYPGEPVDPRLLAEQKAQKLDTWASQAGRRAQSWARSRGLDI
jgi:hypothetical protein